MQHHAFARFVLPVKSTAFSEQEWPGKKAQEDEDQEKQSPKQQDDTKRVFEKDDSEEKDIVSRDEAQANGKNNNLAKVKKRSKKGPEMSLEEKRFLDQLLEEMNVQQSMPNNDARPAGELKLLDKDALEQLESCLAVEDQYVRQL